jgi:uncharacterized protein YdeI (YjbR/CyaY-like superfamily)
MMCSFAAFKNHCALNFWKASLIKSITEEQNTLPKKSMGKFGKITSLKDLPSNKKLNQILIEAMLLNATATKIIKNKLAIKESLEIPDYFIKRLKQNKRAVIEFEKFSISNKKEYITWVEEAKTEITKQIRLEQSIAWITEGKHRNWKYMNKYKSENDK